ncbi:hypothetical protein [Streptomyces sp. NBC_00576]|uniref:hypothetical protein n=1 Tax=Streptomyces sp. NBC_00576 TaxID=2903665 RepID=UPI003FCC8DEC
MARTMPSDLNTHFCWALPLRDQISSGAPSLPLSPTTSMHLLDAWLKMIAPGATGVVLGSVLPPVLC